MRIIKARMIDDYSIDDAHQICVIVEQCLGIALHNKCSKKPNKREGFITTSSDGSCEIHLYDLEDTNLPHNATAVWGIEKLAQESRAREFFSVCSMSDDEILTKLALVDQQREDFEITSGVIHQ